LVATDLRNDYFPVVRKALEIAKLSNAKLSVVNVIPAVPYYMGSGIVNDIEETLEKQSQQRLEQVKKLVDVPAEYYIRNGSAKIEIVKLAEELNVDIIVIGRHDSHRAVELLVGSTAVGVLHRAECDVLIVRVNK
jgi:universal stress protein A